MVRKRGEERADNSDAIRAPSETWLLRTLAELRREQAHPSVPVARPPRKAVKR